MIYVIKKNQRFILKGFLALFVILFSSLGFSSGGGHHGPVEVPTGVIFRQAFNFLLALFVLWYFLRKTIKTHFKSKHEQYHDVVRQVESAKLKAEDLKKTLKEKMVKLDSEAKENAQNAKAEADELHQRLLHDANGLSEKLMRDAKASIEVELQKAKQHLKAELLEQSIIKAQGELKSSVSDSDQQRLKEQFVEKIQVVY